MPKTQAKRVGFTPMNATRVHLHGAEFEGRSFDGPIYYGFRGRRFFSRHFGLEAEFVHLKVFARVERTVEADGVVAGVPVSGPIPMSTIVQQFSISHGLNLLLGNLVLRKSLWRQPGDAFGHLRLAARVGLGGTIPHPESEVLHKRREGYEGGRPAFQAAGGFEVHLWRGFYWLSEYKYTRTRQRVRIAGGTAEGLFQSHHVVTGFSCHL